MLIILDLMFAMWILYLLADIAAATLQFLWGLCLLIAGTTLILVAKCLRWYGM